MSPEAVTSAVIETAEQIEKATLVDLDWALANMEAKTRTSARGTSGKAKWVYEAEASSKKEDVRSFVILPTISILTSHQGDLRGLGALLFDDGECFWSLFRYPSS